MPAATPPPPPVHHPVAALVRPHLVRARPARAADVVDRLAARRPITGVRTAVPVLDRATRGGGTWLRVRLPGRPNGHSGWISARGTTTSTTPWRLEVRLASRTITVWRGARRVERLRVVIGKPSTPTPRGRFFVEEAVRVAPSSTAAPFALALSARSSVYQEFDGGPGQIAIHGRRNIGGIPGTAVSHGCVRVGDRGITLLARWIGPGTPVRIRR